MNMGGIGPLEMILLGVIALIVVGPEKLPEMARKAGKMIHDFRVYASGMTQELGIDQGLALGISAEDITGTPARAAPATPVYNGSTAASAAPTAGVVATAVKSAAPARVDADSLLPPY